MNIPIASFISDGTCPMAIYPTAYYDSYYPLPLLPPTNGDFIYYDQVNSQLVLIPATANPVNIGDYTYKMKWSNLNNSVTAFYFV